MTDTIRDLWNKGKPVDEVVDPYTFLAVRNGLRNYRFFTVASLAFQGLPNVPDHVRTFIKDRPRVLGISNGVVVDGVYRVFSIVFRDLKEKDFCTYAILSGIPYGIGQLEGFQFGDPLAIVEGLKDRDSIRSVYPNVVALCGSSMGRIMREVLLTVTNRFILLYDNDETGHIQTKKDFYNLTKLGCHVKIATHPEGHKDAGEITDLLYSGEFNTSEFLASYHKLQLETLGNHIC